MCGRFSLTPTILDVLDSLNAQILCDLSPSYNIAPSQDVCVARQGENGRELVKLRWGLVPFWMKELPKTTGLINARAETVVTKPSFRAAFKHRRCLIPTDGFYEWKKVDNHKQPYYIQKTDKDLFTFGGIWEHWEKDGNTIESCSIITTEANQQMQEIHDRMPLIIAPADYNTWLDANTNASELLTSYPTADLNIYRVSTYVNNPANNSIKCIESV